MPTPEEWRDVLNARLDARRPCIAHFESYYEGDHRLAFATSKFREAFGRLFEDFSDNWCSVVVDASVERLVIQGFRFGSDDSADDDAWRLFQANELDAQSVISFETSGTTGYAYLLVAPNREDDSTPTITVEHPSEVIVATAPGFRRRRLAALKKWVEADGIAYATLYLPDGIFKWKTANKYRGGQKPRWVARRADADDPDVDEDGYAGDNPTRVVPVIPLLNRATLRAQGRSDLELVIPQQDAVNKLVEDMLVASEFAAYRQRWATGIEVTTDPDTGRVRPPWDPGADKVFASASELAKFGTFEASDLDNYVKAIELVVQHLAAITRTPPHYLLGQSGAFPSGESLKSTETGLVAKVRRKMLTLGEGYEEAIRLALQLVDPTDERAKAVDAETIWKDPESRTEGELVDGLVKLQTIGVPRRALWERLGASPQQIERWEAMAADEAMRAAAAANVAVFGPGGQGVPAEPAPADADLTPAAT